MATKIKIELPDKPSELIRVALADLTTIEKDPRYRVKMSTWHTPPNPDVVALNPNHGLKCDVCLAGAALACHGYPIDRHLDKTMLKRGDVVIRKIAALDCFRRGRIIAGLLELESRGAEDARLGYVHNVPEYELDPEGFKKSLTELADTLEENGY